MHMWFPSIESHQTTLIGEAIKRDTEVNTMYIGEAIKRELKVDFMRAHTHTHTHTQTHKRVTRPFFLEGCSVVRSFSRPYVRCGEPPCVCLCVCVGVCE